MVEPIARTRNTYNLVCGKNFCRWWVKLPLSVRRRFWNGSQTCGVFTFRWLKPCFIVFDFMGLQVQPPPSPAKLFHISFTRTAFFFWGFGSRVFISNSFFQWPQLIQKWNNFSAVQARNKKARCWSSFMCYHVCRSWRTARKVFQGGAAGTLAHCRTEGQSNSTTHSLHQNCRIHGIIFMGLWIHGPTTPQDLFYYFPGKAIPGTSDGHQGKLWEQRGCSWTCPLFGGLARSTPLASMKMILRYVNHYHGPPAFC